VARERNQVVNKPPHRNESVGDKGEIREDEEAMPYGLPIVANFVDGDFI